MSAAMNASSRAFTPVSASGCSERTEGVPADAVPAERGVANSWFRLMAESWPGAVILLDRELSAVWMNTQAATLTGRNAGELAGELAGVPWSDLSLPWMAGAELRARLLSGERLHLECLQRGGRQVSGTLIPLQEAGAEVSAIACVLTEATPHQQSASERDYAASQRRLEAALESAQGGMWDLDLTQRAARRTESYFRMLGDTPHDNPVGMRSWRARVHPDDLHRVESTAQAVIEGRRPFYEAEYRYRHADGCGAGCSTVGE